MSYSIEGPNLSQNDHSNSNLSYKASDSDLTLDSKSDISFEAQSSALNEAQSCPDNHSLRIDRSAILTNEESKVSNKDSKMVKEAVSTGTILGSVIVASTLAAALSFHYKKAISITRQK